MAPKNQRWWLTQDSASVVIDAPPERIYDLVADLPRMGEWSPECQRVEWADGATDRRTGATFVGHNRGGPGRPHEVVATRAGCWPPSRVASSPSSPRRAAASPPSGTTASSRSTAAPGSPSPTRCDGSPRGPGSSTSRPTGTASCGRRCDHTLGQLKTAAEVTTARSTS